MTEELVKDMTMPGLLREMLELDEQKSHLTIMERRVANRKEEIVNRLTHLMEALGAPSMKIVHPRLNVAMANWLEEEFKDLKAKSKRDKGSVERNVGMRSQYWAALEKDPEVHGLANDGEVFRKALGYFRQMGFREKLQPMLHSGALSSVVRERIELAELLPGQQPGDALPPRLRKLIRVTRTDKLTVTKTSNQSKTSRSMAARRG